MSRQLDKRAGADYRPWNIPDLAEVPASGAIPGGQAAGGRAPHAGRVGRSEGYAEGFELGRSEGLAAGEQECAGKAAQLARLLSAMARPYEEVEDQVEECLVSLATAVARNLVRREIKQDPEIILAVVNEAAAMLRSENHTLQVRLHPEDALLVREMAADPAREASWKVVEDPGIMRGGCFVVTDTAQIDATVETRLNSLITSVFTADQDG